MLRIQFAQKAVIVDDGRVLMVRKSSEDPYNPHRWELPGGRLEGAEDLDAHIRREVEEETGLSIEPGELIDLWSWDIAVDGEPVRVIAVSRHCYLKERIGVRPKRAAGDYIDDQMWIPKSELLSLNLIRSQVPTLKSIIE